MDVEFDTDDEDTDLESEVEAVDPDSWHDMIAEGWGLQ